MLIFSNKDEFMSAVEEAVGSALDKRDGEKPLTVSELAKEFGCTPATIRAWVKNLKLVPVNAVGNNMYLKSNFLTDGKDKVGIGSGTAPLPRLKKVRK